MSAKADVRRANEATRCDAEKVKAVEKARLGAARAREQHERTQRKCASLNGQLEGQLWMITWMAMVSSRDRPREGARGAQRTHRGVQGVPIGETRRSGVAS